jgi:hypothetical protein
MGIPPVVVRIFARCHSLFHNTETNDRLDSYSHYNCCYIMGFNKKNTVCFRFILSADRYWTLIAVILDYFLLLKAFKPLQT